MYIVVGASGYFGSYIIKNILSNTDSNILAVNRNVPDNANKRIHWVSCDISNAKETESLCTKYLRNSRENKIIYLAAYHHPDMVERFPKLAWDINITSLSRFLNLAENVKCFFYASTDSVYGESINGYHFAESDPPNPVNKYGRHKCVAETLTTAYGYNVLRFPFLISPSIVPNRKHFYDMIVDDIKRGKPVKLFNDSFRSTLSFDTAAAIAVKLMETYKEAYPKILNIGGDDDLSKYDVGLMIADKLNLSKELVKAISVKNSKEIFKVQRASSSLLDNRLLKNTLNISSLKLVI